MPVTASSRINLSQIQTKKVNINTADHLISHFIVSLPRHWRRVHRIRSFIIDKQKGFEMKVLIIYSAFLALAYGFPQNVDNPTIPSPAVVDPGHGTPGHVHTHSHNHGAYGGRGAYGGLGFAGPFHGGPISGLREGLKCVGTELKLTDTLNQTMKDCHDKIYTDWEESGKSGIPPLETRACGIVCTAQGIGLLDKYGRPKNTVIAEHIEKVYPPEVTADLTAAIIDCGEKYGQEVTIKDGSCASFEMFIGCVKSSVRRICSPPVVEQPNSAST